MNLAEEWLTSLAPCLALALANKLSEQPAKMAAYQPCNTIA